MLAQRNEGHSEVTRSSNVEERPVSSETQLEGKQKANIAGRILEMLGDSAIKTARR